MGFSKLICRKSRLSPLAEACSHLYESQLSVRLFRPGTLLENKREGQSLILDASFANLRKLLDVAAGMDWPNSEKICANALPKLMSGGGDDTVDSNDCMLTSRLNHRGCQWS